MFIVGYEQMAQYHNPYSSGLSHFVFVNLDTTPASVVMINTEENSVKHQ